MDIFSKLDSLKSIEPSESWIVDTKKKVLSEAPVFERENVLENNIDKKANLGFNLQNLFQNLSFKKVMIPAFSLVFVLSTGVFTVGASKSSLPGDFLYSIKMINEDMALVVAPKDKKAEVEMEQVGKRIEEFGKISQNYSDPKQGEKIEMILGEIEVKTNRAEEHLTGIEDDGVKMRVAKVVGAQGEKNTEVLAETSEDLLPIIQEEISEGVAKAIDSNEKIYLTSFAVVAEEEEINDDVSEEDQDNSVEDGDDTEEDGETKGAEEDAEEEPLDDSENDSEELDNPDDGDVLGVEDNIENNNEDDIVEEEILEETEEEVVKEEIDEEVNESL